VKGFHGRGGLVTPLSPPSLSADLNGPRQGGRSRIESNYGEVSITRSEVEPIDRDAESESGTTSTHLSLGRSYTLSLPDDSRTTDPDAESLRTGIRTCSARRRRGVYASLRHLCQASTERLMTSLVWANPPATDSLASSIAKEDTSETATKPPRFDLRPY